MDDADGNQPLAVFTVVPVEAMDAWTVKATVIRAQGPVQAWAPYLFWTEQAAQLWLGHHAAAPVRPSVRDCPYGSSDRAYAALVGDDGRELFVSEPLDRFRALGAAASFAAEFRALA